jgi:hypothetical protein
VKVALAAQASTNCVKNDNNRLICVYDSIYNLALSEKIKVFGDNHGTCMSGNR